MHWIQDEVSKLPTLRGASLVLTSVGILGLTPGFALPEVASNFMAGVLIELRRPVQRCY
jgi:small-conductance mechanosensitive channel